MENGVIIYIIAKFIGYSIWSFVGIWLFEHKINSVKAIGLGVFRLLLGIGFGLMIFITYHPDRNASLAIPYVLIYTPVRWLEWSIIAKSINPKDNFLWSSFAQMNVWRFIGILVSYGLDLFSPEGIAGMFCVGRCLC